MYSSRRDSPIIMLFNEYISISKSIKQTDTRATEGNVETRLNYILDSRPMVVSGIMNVYIPYKHVLQDQHGIQQTNKE